MCHAHALLEDTDKQTKPMNDPQTDADWEDARKAWRDEHEKLINLWNCTEPMTPAQIARMEELDARIRGMRVELPKGEAVASEGRKYNDPKLSDRRGGASHAD